MLRQVVSEDAPCTDCTFADCDAPISLDHRTFACKGCHYTRYCNSDCQKQDWANHRSFCRKLRAEPGLVAFLDYLYRVTGLYTDGHEWLCVPVRATTVLHAMHRMGVFPDNDYGTGSVTALLARIRDPPATFYTTTLTQRYIGFREYWYGVVTPAGVRQLVDHGKGLGVTKFVDPMSGSGILAACLHHFGGVAASDIRCADLQTATSDEHFWPTEEADCLAFEGYEDVDWDITALVLSWPDFYGKPAISTPLLQGLYAMGMQHVVVMTTTSDNCAMADSGIKVLQSLYYRDETLNIPPFSVGCLDVRDHIPAEEVKRLQALMAANGEPPFDFTAPDYTSLAQCTFWYTRKQ